jgi:hypothetical protein
MNFSRGIVLVLVTGCLAALGSFLMLVPNGLMAAALAMCLSVGTIWLSRKQQRTGMSPERNEIVVVGLLTGLVGGGMAALIQGGLALPSHEFLPPPMPTWNLVLAGALYGVVLHLACRRHSLASALFSAGLGCFAVRMLSGIVTGLEPLSVIFLALFGAVPFGILWTLATFKIRPAWKSEPLPSPEARLPHGAETLARHD